MRHLIIVLAAATIMVLGFVASWLILGDQARLKQLVADHVYNQTGRQLTIDGAVSVSFFPRLRIDAHQIRLSGPEDYSGPDLLRSESIGAEIRLLPLMLGRIETGEVSLQDARLNLLVDESGAHGFAGMIRRAGREGAPGLVARGPVRLEDLEIQIGSLGFGASQRLLVERVMLDRVAFDRALQLRFEGAIGVPAWVEAVSVDGLLFVPAAEGHFRLTDMKMAGRMAGARRPFELLGTMGFSAIPPLALQLDDGRLRAGGQELRIQGAYESRQRPLIKLEVEAGGLDGRRLADAFGSSTGRDWPDTLIDWIGSYDLQVDFVAERLEVFGVPLAAPRLSAHAEDGFGRIRSARAGFPGGIVEIEGDVRVDPSESILTGVARLDVDDLGLLLDSAGSTIDAEGAGQISIRPAPENSAQVLYEAELEFFDGRWAGLDTLRELAGGAPGDRFRRLVGRLLIYEDAVAFPDLRIFDEDAEIALDGFWLRESGVLSGLAEWVVAGQPSLVFSLGGKGQAPLFVALVDDDVEQ
ncbi:MAG: AsmA family protein [Wenzhouxiangella sp.]|nr:MAG: AsmA family protein [Wenzhouxiangella sp.]